MENSEITILGFDYGSKRIGVAVGQTLTNTATPLTQINVTANQPDWQHIEKLIKEWRPDVVVVGLPLNMDETRGPMVQAAENFIKQLQKRFQVPVKSINELLSTRAAKERLTESRGNTRWSKEELNSVAAQIIVETYLSTLK